MKNRIYFCKIFTAANANTKNCGSNSLQDSLVVLTVIFGSLQLLLIGSSFCWLLLLYLNRLHYAWGKCPKLETRQTWGKHTRSLLLLFPLYYKVVISVGVVLHNFKMLLQPAVSWLSTTPVFQYCILSYYDLTGNLETHGSCGVKTLHFGVEVTIPSTILEHSALLICHSLPLQEMFSLLMQQDPPCWGKFSREEKAALTWH